MGLLLHSYVCVDGGDATNSLWCEVTVNVDAVTSAYATCSPGHNYPNGDGPVVHSGCSMTTRSVASQCCFV